VSRVFVVTGSRESAYSLCELVGFTLYLAKPEFLILGDCPTGVDAYAKAWAILAGVRYERHIADWRGPLRKKAGPARNGKMVARGVLLEAEVIAFPRRGPGTRDCMKQASAAGLTVHVIRSADDAERLWAPATGSQRQSGPAGAGRP
jgi:hypothetical protein